VSCAKTAELIEMQFGARSQLHPGNMIAWGCRCPVAKGTFGMSGRLKSIVKHGIWGVG